ncbi:murein hydrolase activator EnvC [Testudinibacter sp. TR-2022]|uniref:murein hydrolase activator EnvC n=1 Tax=Testudinibacter sp. TR-2022 TaxID=2585029 RepID=UPI0011185B04|nr:murein hydrolase activator EnvC [Testudinibacter sp. TR-2022]TNH04848.1 murein hydrolase activator EnvC [Pasteurellaceae bacterium Phil31]TNH05043.1 murein hydrolase activator EnvC [Testudinibacter sp. TR-2022]TNH11813.1 murein hydrolase activator EnvC [Testudinibacter sp. TR-2022]TNH18343.1 murein hydrolase activator EnvC [Testudinibacter sp. TR-2022]
MTLSLSLVLAFVLLSYPESSYANQQDLSKIQQQIKQQQQQLAQQRQEQNRLQQELKKQENSINNVLGELRKTEQDLGSLRQNIRETDKQIAHLEKQLATQKQKLAEQLDSAYRAGLNPSVIEKMLSEKAQESDRMYAYYQQFNRTRSELIESIKQTQASLEKQKAEAQQQQKQQQAILNKQKQSQSSLQKTQNERKSTLTKLDRSIKQGENRLEVLKENENSLKRSIAQAEQRARQREQQELAAYQKKKAEQEKKSDKPYQPTETEKQLTRKTSGLGAGKKQYALPTSGSIANRFGSVQMGELRWKGIVINSSNGAAVQAIADGRVILADWLQGYGLMVVVDHGAGDMSLYGYNQRLSVQNGQFVKRGQKIAEVGSSGGQGKSSLYFEIRRKGNPVNPLNWVK